MDVIRIEPVPVWAAAFYETPSELSERGETILTWMESLDSERAHACAQAIRDWDISTARKNGLLEWSELWVKERREDSTSSP